jgi:hypothetical protein
MSMHENTSLEHCCFIIQQLYDMRAYKLNYQTLWITIALEHIFTFLQQGQV